MVQKVSNWKKFKLLFWKNWLLQWQHKFGLIIFFSLPIFCCALTAWVRSLKPINHLPETRYAAVDLSQKTFPTYNLGYTPENDYIDNIVWGAVLQLGAAKATPYRDAKILEEALKRDEIDVGIVFDSTTVQLEDYPTKLKYTIRLPSIYFATHSIFPFALTTSPKSPNDGLASSGYANFFIYLQNALSISFLAEAGKGTGIPNIYLARRPTHGGLAYDELIYLMREFTYTILFMSYIVPLIMMTRHVAAEREYQLKEIMKMIGVSNWIHWVAWFLKCFILFTILNIAVTMIFTIPWSEGTAVLNFTNWFFFLFVLTIYVTACLCFSFMITVLFTQAAIAGAAVGLIAYLIHMPYEFLREFPKPKSSQVLPSCLFVNSALGFALRNVYAYEALEEGAGWSNMFTPPPGSEVALGYILLLMLTSSILCILICLYIEQINPGAFGLPKKWYFPFKPSFWSNKKKDLQNEDTTDFKTNNRRLSSFEAEPINKNPGVVIQNLRKRYGNNVAVKNVTLNMYPDEITVLLGHNGAGKSTTISILTGMIPSSGGTILIDGYDLKENLDEARMVMGVCPQHNVLFEEMSVVNHIKFYASLKGVEGENLQEEISKYLKLIDLESKANVAASKLSGGQKRKLSVVCALCGQTKVVFLDEPSAGMDPAARRHLWEVLQQEKIGRVILLTTHFMDEADLLGDHVAIMCNGEVKCYGSPFFLKKRFGSGYHLIIVKLDGCESEKVTRFMQRYLPGLPLSSDIGSELSYILPENYVPIFEDLFQGLDKNLSLLKISGYGISVTTMEEVFMKVGEESHAIFEEGTRAIDESADPMFSKKLDKVKGLKLFGYHWEAMFLKRFMCFWRSIYLLLVQVSILILLLALEIAASDSNPIYEDQPPLTMSLSSYPRSVTVLSVPQIQPPDSVIYVLADEYEGVVKEHDINHKFKSTGEPFPDYFLKLNEPRHRIAVEYIGGASFNNLEEIIVWFNPQLQHEMSLSLNLVHNALARLLIGPDSEIEVVNHPLPLYKEDYYLWFGTYYGKKVAETLGFATPFIIATFIAFIIRDAASRSKLLQFMSGINIWIYWLANILWDTLVFIIISLCFLLVLSFYRKDGLTDFEDLKLYFLLLLIFGVSAICVTYFLSFFFNEPATGYTMVVIIYLLTGLILQRIRKVVVHVDGERDAANAMRAATRIFPFNALIEGFMKLYDNGFLRRVCESDRLSKFSKAAVCKQIPDCCDIKDYFGIDNPGILVEVISLIVAGTLSFIGVVLFEYHIFKRIAGCFQRRQKQEQQMSQTATVFDNDVLAEKELIKRMSKQEIESQNLVVDSISKFYGGFHAVRDISLLVKRKECFGLMGVNGAGKTTTFKMLTGDALITFGSAYINGISIRSNIAKAYNRMGYCPQFDALLDDMTGREVLKMYCLLRGIPRNKMPAVINYLAYGFGFEKHLNKRTKSYSGGNRRKLSTAVATIGNPSVVFLDEPTTGMDPSSRRQMWNMVCFVRDSGKSLVLTTHSMEECEALCTRVAIMVNGEFKCLGSIQHLKNKFSKGIVLKIKMKQDQSRANRFSLSFKTERKSEEFSNVPFIETLGSERPSTSRQPSNAGSDTRLIKNFIQTNFPNARLQEEYQSMLTYHIPLASAEWSKLFGMMEKNRQTLNYEDYSISQTSFEDIFLSFALQQQTDPRDVTKRPKSKKSLFK